MTGAARWIEHSAMSDPGDVVAAVIGLPSDIAAINRIIQGLLIHAEWLATYGVDASSFSDVSRQTLPVAERWAIILERDARPLDMLRQAFITADQAWLDCRFGHGRTKGQWFLKVNLIRDRHDVNHREVPACDDWRAAPAIGPDWG